MAPFGASRAGLMSVAADDIPDSVVSRPEDDGDSNDFSGESGVVIETKSEWPSIGARISNNTVGATRAYLRDDGGAVISETDISSLVSGDTFTFDDVNLDANTTYQIVLDAEGSDFDHGNFSDTIYPYESPDVDIIARIFNGEEPVFDDGAPVVCVNDIGNTGFD